MQRLVGSDAPDGHTSKLFHSTSKRGGVLEVEIVWHIEQEDIERVRAFCDSYRNDPFVQRRIERNLGKTKHEISKGWFWQVMVGCLLTTQQRSGPSSPISRFFNTRPFPLRYDIAIQQDDLERYTKRVLVEFGGIRRFNKIASAVATNLDRLEAGLWSETLERVNGLDLHSSCADERETATFVDDHFKGFGPKQSRSLLQWLGLTTYEIPLDSRITKWLNEFGFPVGLSAGALSDRNYYNFVSDGVQELCAQSDIYPCVLDAVIFTSFDRGGWTEDNMVY
jgi:hypothetical protein